MLFCLLVLVFTLHLLCMNLASTGLVVGSFAECFAKQDPANQGAANQDAVEPGLLAPLFATRFAAQIAASATLALFLGGLLGGVLLLFFWDESYQDLFTRRLRSRAFFGLCEIAFSLVLHLIYWRWAASQASSPRPSRYWRLFLAFVSSLNLLYHFPTLFAIVAQVAKASTPESELIGRTQMYAFLGSGPILSHALHFFLASIATSGVFGAMLASSKSASPAASFIRKLCTTFALLATFLQLPVGIWVYLTLPAASQRSLMGDNLPLSIAFIASLGCALWLIQSLAGQLSNDAPKNKPYWSAAALTLTILLMSGVLWGTRTDRLERQQPNKPQTGAPD